MPGNSRRARSLARSPHVQSMLADESAADMKRRHEHGWGARRISWEARLAAISSCSDHRRTTRKLCVATELQRAATWTKASVIVRPGKLRAQEAGSLQHVVPLKTRLEGSPPLPLAGPSSLRPQSSASGSADQRRFESSLLTGDHFCAGGRLRSTSLRTGSADGGGHERRDAPARKDPQA